MERPKSLKDILSGLIFVGLGLAFGIAAYGYDIGTALRMGPGYFPIVLAGALCAFGLAILVKGLVAATGTDDLGVFPWRGVVLLLASLAFFGATIRGLGLVPALFITVALAAMSSRQNTPRGALLLAAGMTLFCVLIFTWGLGVPLALFGPWVRF